MSGRIPIVYKALLSLLVGAVPLAGIYWWFGSSQTIKLDNAFVVGRVIRIDAPMSGVVESVNVTRFSTLQKESVAFVVGGRDTANKVRTAKIALRAALSEAGQSCVKLDSQLERVRIADLSKKLADEFMADTQQLVGQGYVSRHEVERQQIEQHKARVAHQMELLEKRRLEMDVGEWAPGTGKLAAAIEQLRQAWTERLRASVALQEDIFVYDIHVLPGQWVEEGAPLATVVPVEPLRVQANILESQIGRVFTGQAAQVHVDGLDKNMILHGHVETIVPATAATFSQVQRNRADSTWLKVSQRIPVVIQIDDPVPQGQISVGQSAEVALVLGTKASGPADPHGPNLPPPSHPVNEKGAIDHMISLELNRERSEIIKHLRLPPGCNMFRLDTMDSSTDDLHSSATVLR